MDCGCQIDRETSRVVDYTASVGRKWDMSRETSMPTWLSPCGQSTNSSFTIDALLSRPSHRPKQMNGSNEHSLDLTSRNSNSMMNGKFRMGPLGVGINCLIPKRHIFDGQWREGNEPTMVQVDRTFAAYYGHCAECDKINNNDVRDSPTLPIARSRQYKAETLDEGHHGNKHAKRRRTIFTAEQLDRLEHEFKHQQYIVGQERRYLAVELGLNEIQVKVWFQNRRIKWRKQRLGRHPLSPMCLEHYAED